MARKKKKKYSDDVLYFIKKGDMKRANLLIQAEKIAKKPV